MPRADFGEKTHFDGSRTEFIQLKSKEEKVHVRFLGSALYDGKHFIKQEDGKWLVTYCPRIMSKGDCQYCEKFFTAKKAMKKMKNDLGDVDKMKVSDKAVYKGLEREAERFGATISFFYPVLDRDREVAGILKCTQSIRWKLDEEYSNGVSIMKFDYIIKRTEKPGTDYYTLTRMDSADTKPLTEKELEQIKLAESWNIEEMIYGNKSTFDIAEEATPEEEPIDEEYLKESRELKDIDDSDIDEITEGFDGELPKDPVRKE